MTSHSKSSVTRATPSLDNSGLAFRFVDELQETFEKMGIPLPQYNGDDAWELPIPGTYVVGQDGTITLAYVDANYTTPT